jgi:hypothetical protein
LAQIGADFDFNDPIPARPPESADSIDLGSFVDLGSVSTDIVDLSLI